MLGALKVEEKCKCNNFITKTDRLLCDIENREHMCSKCFSWVLKSENEFKEFLAKRKKHE